MDPAGNALQVAPRPLEITDHLFTDFHGEFRRQIDQILFSDVNYLKQHSEMAKSFFMGMFISVFYSKVASEHKIEKGYFYSSVGDEPYLMFAVVRRDATNDEFRNLEIYGVEIEQGYKRRSKLQFCVREEDHHYLLQHLGWDFPGFVHNNREALNANILVVDLTSSTTITAQVVITKREITGKPLMDRTFTLTPDENMVNALDFNRFDPNTNIPPRGETFGHDYLSEMTNNRNEISRFFDVRASDKINIYLFYHGSLMSWWKKWSFEIDSNYSPGLSQSANSGLKSKILGTPNQSNNHYS